MKEKGDFLDNSNLKKILTGGLLIILSLFILIEIFTQKRTLWRTHTVLTGETIILEESNKIIASEPTDDKLRGTIFDRNGIKLSYTKFDKDNPDIYNREFNSDYNKCFSNIVDGFATSLGLDTVFSKTLRMHNPTYVNKLNNIGRSIHTTLDAKIQDEIYNKVLYYQKTGIDYVTYGSVIVMKRNGEILSEVSCPSFDLNKYRTEYITRIDETGLGTTDNKALENVELNPNIFKDLFKTIMESKKKINYKELETSLNEMFGFSMIECDFGNIENSISYNFPKTKMESVSISPVFLAVYSRACVFGEAVKPYVLKNVVDTTDYKNVIEKGSTPNEVIGVLPDEYKNTVKENFTDIRQYNIDIPDNFQLYGDTYSEGNTYYMYGVLYNESSVDDSYIIVLQVMNDNNSLQGDDPMQKVADIYENIVKVIT